MAKRSFKLDRSKLAKDRAKAKGGVVRLRLEEGDTLVYICPPVHDDNIPYAEFQIAYGLGKDFRKSCGCFVGLKNREPFTGIFVDKLGKSLDEAKRAWRRCSELIDEYGDPNRQRFKDRWVFSVVPMGHRKMASRPWQDPIDQRPHLLEVGPTVFGPVIDKMLEIEDISDWDAATFLIIRRDGQGVNTTYTVDWDIESARKPVALDAEVIETIERDCVPTGDGDPWWLAAFSGRTVEKVEEFFGLTTDSESDAPARSVRSKSVKSRKPNGSQGDMLDESVEGNADDLDSFLANKAGGRKGRRTRKAKRQVEATTIEHEDIPF